MQVSEATIGRIFTIRLEDGEVLPRVLEDFAESRNVSRAFCLFVGGIGSGGRLVVGPEKEGDMPPVPMVHVLEGVHEILAAGTLFPDEDGRPRLHAHAALGRKEHALTGCIRMGVSVWKTVEIVLLELKGGTGKRVFDPESGFHLFDAQKT